MQGPAPGSLIAGRYALARQMESHQDYQRWAAADQVLGRDVCLYLLPADSANAAAVVDAGRQAGALQDPRFVRVLDADVDGDLAYVAEDLVAVSDSLVGLLAEGPLGSEDARRAVGEAATALARAEARGLHHLALTPHSLYLLDDGQVKVRGVATRAALAGLDHTDPAEASRIDAAGLVALLFAALTGRWPQPEHRDGMPVLADAEATGLAGVQPGDDDRLDPGRLAHGIPDDLRELCATLGTDELPASPQEVARHLEPWTVVGSGLAGAAGAAAAGTGPGAAVVGANGDGGSDGAAGPSGSDAHSEGGAVTAALGTAWSVSRRAAAGAASAAGHKIEELRDRTEARRSEAQRRAEDEQRRRAAMPGIDETLATAPAAPPEAAAPILPGPIEKPSTRSTVILLSLILVLLLGAAAFAARGLFAPVGTHPPVTASPTVSKGSTTGAQAPVTGTTGPGGTAAPTTSAPVNVMPGEPITPKGVTVFNPSGGPDEGSGSAPKAIDGDVTTQWRSRWSTRADWFGRKTGLGLIVDLGKAQPVGSVALTLPAAPQDLQIFVTSAPSMAGVQAVADKPGSSGQFTVTLARQVTGQYVIVWITKMGQAESPTQFRAMINEIKVTT